jgi:hypothetical protein
MRQLRVLAVLPILICTMAACSFVWSSESISDSVKSSSDSSSSSSPGSAEEAYEGDVRDYTYAFVTSGGSRSDFRQGLSRIAEKHGVTNWEGDMATYTGIGMGLRKANANSAELQAYEESFAGNDAAKRQAIERGYAKKGTN